MAIHALYQMAMLVHRGWVLCVWTGAAFITVLTQRHVTPVLRPPTAPPSTTPKVRQMIPSRHNSARQQQNRRSFALVAQKGLWPFSIRTLTFVAKRTHPRHLRARRNFKMFGPLGCAMTSVRQYVISILILVCQAQSVYALMICWMH